MESVLFTKNGGTGSSVRNRREREILFATLIPSIRGLHIQGHSRFEKKSVLFLIINKNHERNEIPRISNYISSP